MHLDRVYKTYNQTAILIIYEDKDRAGAVKIKFLSTLFVYLNKCSFTVILKQSFGVQRENTSGANYRINDLKK